MNLPNKITISRIALIPIIIALYLITAIPCGKFIATILFIVAASTDFLDGYIARKYNLVTDTGKFLDPIADKILVMAGLLIIFQAKFIPIEYLILAVIIIFTRDHLVNSLRQIASAKGIVIAAAMSGKIKAASLDIAVALIMFYQSVIQLNWFSAVLQNAFWWLSVVALAFSVFMVIYSTFDYFIKNKEIFKSKQTSAINNENDAKIEDNEIQKED